MLPKEVKELLRKWLPYKSRGLLQAHKLTLVEILNRYQDTENSPPVIIFPPSLDWDVQLFQRPQQLALALARQGALVFYCQPKPDIKKEPFKLIAERLFLCIVNIDVFNGLKNPWIYLLTWNSEFARLFDQPKIIYDYVDDIDVFYGDRNSIIEGHRRLLQNASLVLVTARKLFEEAAHLREDAIYSPNGVDLPHFLPAARKEFPQPPQQMELIIKTGKPVIGYYGALARWFDYDLLQNLAKLRKDYEFVLIGPDYDGTLTKTKILSFTNVHWLGVVPYKDLPHYIQYFDVATIPFIVNEITHATSPLKLFEYMASEKPTVITPMRESIQYPGVLVGETPDEFAEKIDLALKLRDDESYRTELRSTAKNNTWDQRAQQILAAIQEKDRTVSMVSNNYQAS